MPYNEKELLLRVAKGEEQAFGQLLQRHHIKIYQTVLRITGDQWMAEEVVQDTFLKVWLKRDYLPELINFDAWLCSIAGNMTFDAIRRSKRKKNAVEDWVGEFYLNTSELPQEHLYKEILEDAMRQLPPRQQEVLRLIKIQGYTRDEAAKKINISCETVKSHLEQALRNVRAFCIAKRELTSLFVILLHTCP